MLVETTELYAQAVARINENDHQLTEDTETDGLAWQHDSKICSVQIRHDAKNYYFPFRHKQGRNLPEKYLRDLMTRVMRPDRKQLYFNGAYDIKMGAKDGQAIPHHGCFEDAYTQAYLCNENEPSHKMESLADRYLGKGFGDAEEALLDKLQGTYGGPRKGAKQHLHKLPASEVYAYGTQDIETTERLRDAYRPMIDKWNVRSVVEGVQDFKLELMHMELSGMLVDRDRLEELETFAVEEEYRLRKEIEESAGYKINPGSTKQASAWLGTKGTNKAVLSLLKDDDPRVQLLQDWRSFSRLRSTYLTPYRNSMRDGDTVWYNLNAERTVTGRLSCTDIAMQTVPRYDPDDPKNHYRVKEVFCAPPGKLLLELDLSLAELRLAAHYSRDVLLTKLIQLGADMHSFVATKNGVRRIIAKGMNFSAWYGIGVDKFAQQFHVTQQEARKYLRDWHALFTGAKRLLKTAEAMAERHGYIRMFTGRTRKFNTPSARAWTAANAYIQGGIGEIMRLAVMRMRAEVPEFDIRLLVHDSALGYVDEAIAPEVARRCTQIMQEQEWLSLPMIVDTKIGPRWSDMKKVPRTRAGIPAHALKHCKDKSILGPEHA